MHRKGDLAVYIHGDGDIDKTIEYYEQRTQDAEREIASAQGEPDVEDLWRAGNWRGAIAKHKHDQSQSRKAGHFERMIAALKKRKEEKESPNKFHRLSKSRPEWLQDQELLINFCDHMEIFTQRPKGVRGPGRPSQVVAFAVEYGHRSRERLEAHLEEINDGNVIRLLEWKAEYAGAEAQVIALAGEDVDLEFFKADLPSILKIYNKRRPGVELKLVERDRDECLSCWLGWVCAKH